MNLTLILADRPGAAAEVGEALGRAGINIEAFCGFVVNRHGFAHLVVNDVEGARRVLDGVCDIAEEQAAAMVDMADRPGSLGELTRAMSDAGLNLKFLYLATGTRVVVGADNMDGLRHVLAQQELVAVG
ncbi:MAG TPA: amino acid-binding protein [Candidatus Dormibacteraeota bacterium]|nr:amino acid-binding protein [Candidatus Dormibacteraeota bacterium]